MQYLIQFQINIYAVLMLLVIFMITSMQMRIKFPSKKLLQLIILVNIASIITEPLTWVFDTQLYPAAFLINHVTNFLLVLLSPVLAGLLISYVDITLNNDQRRLRKRLYYQGPAILVFILLCINFFTPIYYWIEPEINLYQSGPLLWVNYVLILILYLYTYFLVLVNRNKQDLSRIHTLVVILSLPVIGMIIQTLDSRLNFSWTTISLGILVAYSFFETSPGEKDYLTGLYSRSSYDRYVHQLIDEHRDFQIMMIDLNGFKQINDVEGHHIGDYVLLEFSKILLQTFSREQMVARLAGDEFVIVIESAGSGQAQVEDIYSRCRRHMNPLMQQLQFSYGIEAYQDGVTFNELYIQVDKKMYTHKEELKRIQGP